MTVAKWNVIIIIVITISIVVVTYYHVMFTYILCTIISNKRIWANHMWYNICMHFNHLYAYIGRCIHCTAFSSIHLVLWMWCAIRSIDVMLSLQWTAFDLFHAPHFLIVCIAVPSYRNVYSIIMVLCRMSMKCIAESLLQHRWPHAFKGLSTCRCVSMLAYIDT
jgi:hypothetical protein